MKRNLPIIVILLVLILDQWLKIYVKLDFKYYEQRDLIDGFIELYFIENKGMAFGWVLGGKIGKIILSVFRIIASFFIFFYIRKLYKTVAPLGYMVCIGLIFAGAVGNIIDSLAYGVVFTDSYTHTLAQFMPEQGGYAPMLFGRVVDMLHFTTRWPEWMPYLGGGEVFSPIFNIADASITAGIIAIFIFYKSYFEKEFSKKKKSEVNEEDVVASE